MTLPDERYRSVLMTQKFLLSLLDPKVTPRVPKSIRGQALVCLRHFPSKYDMDLAATESPSVFETKDPVKNLFK